MKKLATHQPLRIRSILVPLDGSAFAEQALPWAALLARRARARLRLVLVHQPPDPPPADVESRRLYTRIELAVRKSEREYLRATVNRLKTEGPLQAGAATLHGRAAETIAGYVDEIGVDLVVMTTHGRGGLERAWLGSVADHLVRRLEVPVLLIRPRGEEVAAPAASEILVPLDGSPRAEAALPPAMAMAKLLDAQLTLLQAVIPLPAMMEPPAALSQGFDDRILSLKRDEAKDYLSNIAAAVKASGLRARCAAVLAASAVQAIQAAAEAPDIGMIALATHGRGGLRRMVLGSVADKLVRTSALPVLVTRPRGR